TILSSIQKLDGNIAALDTDDIAEAVNLYCADARALAASLTGFTSGAGALAATDTILQGIQKLDGNIEALDTIVSALDTDDVTEADRMCVGQERFVHPVLSEFIYDARAATAAETIQSLI